MGNSLTRKLRPVDINSVYEFKDKLGTGSFAVVKRATHKKSKKEVAVKIIKKKNLNAEELATINDEVDILQKIDHPNIVKLYEIFDTAKYLYMVLELLTGGELFERIVSKGNFSEKEAAVVTRDMTLAIKYMHEIGIVHRDLKPENLLYSDTTQNAVIKITDFGLAKFLSTATETMSTPCGTPGYVAPEILKNEKYGPEVDLWSIGVILYILLCGFPPFYDETAAGLYEQIKKGDYDFPSPYWDTISDEAKNLVTRLLTVNPKERCTYTELLEHPWIAGDKARDVNLGEQFNKKLQQFNARRKLRKAITMVLAVNKLARTLGGFTDLDSKDSTE
eukprot:TRINITY_DN19838_c0_g1_i3.p2 TRINITY_DN19838_c0_g1~~TRINITY_DN19838_c0_g1_i3.p2  ORF type:complete len:360 (+),score=107.61 TRINITY_DN19838_c0_g1_i3:79-1080(+)